VTESIRKKHPSSKEHGFTPMQNFFFWLDPKEAKDQGSIPFLTLRKTPRA